jgi:hypothetical protein
MQETARKTSGKCVASRRSEFIQLWTILIAARGIKENEWSYKVAMAGLQGETDQSNDKGL